MKKTTQKPLGEILWEKIEAHQGSAFISDSCRDMNKRQLISLVKAATRHHQKCLSVLVIFSMDDLQMDDPELFSLSLTHLINELAMPDLIQLSKPLLKIINKQSSKTKNDESITSRKSSRLPGRTSGSSTKP